MSTSLLRPLRRLTWLLLPAGLLGGCHSAQTAFSFRPAPLVAPAAAETPPPADAPAALVATTPAASSARALPPPPTRRAPHHDAAVDAWSAQGLRPHASKLRHLLTPRAVARHQTARRPTDEGRRPHDTFHIILGSVLIVGSIVVGLWLGGWLGLGVGAAIMLLGDYFLVLGIGGKHAWLEIFQEFFNM